MQTAPVSTPMKTNTEYLMQAFGWSGGTVHQLAKETGLTVPQILDLKGDGDPQGWFAARTCSLEHRLSVCFPARKGDTAFWAGVLAGMKSLDKYPGFHPTN